MISRGFLTTKQKKGRKGGGTGRHATSCNIISGHRHAQYRQGQGQCRQGEQSSSEFDLHCEPRYTRPSWSGARKPKVRNSCARKTASRRVLKTLAMQPSNGCWRQNQAPTWKMHPKLAPDQCFGRAVKPTPILRKCTLQVARIIL